MPPTTSYKPARAGVHASHSTGPTKSKIPLGAYAHLKSNVPYTSLPSSLTQGLLEPSGLFTLSLPHGFVTALWRLTGLEARGSFWGALSLLIRLPVAAYAARAWLLLQQAIAAGYADALPRLAALQGRPALLQVARAASGSRGLAWGVGEVQGGCLGGVASRVFRQQGACLGDSEWAASGSRGLVGEQVSPQVPLRVPSRPISIHTLPSPLRHPHPLPTNSHRPWLPPVRCYERPYQLHRRSATSSSSDSSSGCGGSDRARLCTPGCGSGGRAC